MNDADRQWIADEVAKAITKAKVHRAINQAGENLCHSVNQLNSTLHSLEMTLRITLVAIFCVLLWIALTYITRTTL